MMRNYEYLRSRIEHEKYRNEAQNAYKVTAGDKSISMIASAVVETQEIEDNA